MFWVPKPETITHHIHHVMATARSICQNLPEAGGPVGDEHFITARFKGSTAASGIQLDLGR